MSRHFIDCELHCSVRVRLGYDQSQKEFFLDVEHIGAIAEQGYSRYLYSSTRDLFDRADDLEYYEERLAKLGLVVPREMYQAVQDDAAQRVGDRCVQYFADGRKVEPATD